MPPMPSVIEGALSEEVQALGDAELITPPPVYEWHQFSYWFGPAPWDVGVNFGLNGSEGENRSQSIASGAYVKRDSERWTLDSKISYNMTAANSIETQNNAMLDARVDRKIDKSAWSLFMNALTLSAGSVPVRRANSAAWKMSGRRKLCSASTTNISSPTDSASR
jgi:hypothetical protein